jgi:iron complex outermembrane receptor protein
MKKTQAASLASLLIASLAAAGAAQAQDASKDEGTKLESVTITTSTRAAKAVDKIPGAVTVVTEQEIQDTAKLTLDNTAVLTRMVPGYAEASQNLASNGETLRGRTALRLFDGVPQTMPLRDGNRTSAFTDMGIVGRIEVINGPSATEGIGASGGIINYLTKVPTKNGNEFTLSSQYATQFKNDSSGYRVGMVFTHKEDAFDFLGATSSTDRGMEYDGNGRRMGMGQSGSTIDSTSRNLFLKFGFNFGAQNEQRLTLSASKFHLDGKGDYVEVVGSRALGIPDTSVPGRTPGGLAEFNAFNQYALKYTNDNLWGGGLTVHIYNMDEHTRFLSECGTTDCLPLAADGSNLNKGKQDPLIAPIGTLVEQSETQSFKHGVKTNWTTDHLGGVQDLELNTGVDVVQDRTEQKLALTNRVWVPPMLYKSVAPYAQLAYTLGMATLSGGVRHEGGQLEVDDYTTVWAVNRAFVKGGTLDYSDTLPNLGLVLKFAPEWSAFASYSKGFTLPNVGIPLRNVNVPGKSVTGLFADLQAVIADNKEIGVTWMGKSGYVTASTYRSYSELGSSISGSAAIGDYILTRKPVYISGYEISGEYDFSKAWKATALYSHVGGLTSATQVVPGQPLPPLTVQLGVNDVSPNKLVTSVNWKGDDRWSARLGTTTFFELDTNPGTSSHEHSDAYTLVDLGINYDLKKYGTVSLGIDNLFNRYYLLSYSAHDLFQNFFSGRGRKVSLNHTITF